ncbi:cbb3-type cytochrome oxidase subunit 3 [Allostreptomyces psammosilenae]|uniref:Cbb3-type cytochrome oxidase subunit 3 n=1 Tax=Allostreptomyces psammosilenae TaxID=1892865 RepID=A0A853AA67_9ACTN|nr:cbb3-type cytochrome oxidase subunit 3 [Allostreptomyces psammosilenae]
MLHYFFTTLMVVVFVAVVWFAAFVLLRLYRGQN